MTTSTRQLADQQVKRLFFLETRWGLGGGTVFNAYLARKLFDLENLTPVGLSIDPTHPDDTANFLKGLVDFPIHSSLKQRFTRRRFLHDAYAVIRAQMPERIIFTVNSKTCEVVRHLPSHVVRIGVVHAVDVDNVALAGCYSKHLDAIVCVSQMGLDMLNSLSPPPCCPCYFIPPGILLPEAPLKRESTGGHPLRLLYLGRLAEEAKRARSIVGIATALRERGVPFQWNIAGSGPEAGFVAQALDELKVGEVVLIGNVSHHEVPGLFSKYDVIVSTSDREAFPLALQEAMAFGLVPVAGDAPGRVSDIVQAAGGFLVDVNNPAKFAEAISVLHEDRELLTRLSEQASQAISEELGWDCIAKRWQALLASPALQARDEKAWPRRLSVLPCLDKTLPDRLMFLQSIGESLASLIELLIDGHIRRLRKIYYRFKKS